MIVIEMRILTTISNRMMLRNKEKTSGTNLSLNRRRSKGRKPIRKAAGRNGNQARQMPPVMIRGVAKSSNQLPERRAKSKIKRRVDIALRSSETPGVEIRLPSFPAVRLNWRVLSILIISILAWFLYFFWTSPIFQVSLVEVKGALRVTPDEIIRALNLTDKTVFAINPRKMEKTLAAAFSELTNISVQIILPATVLVEVNERVPMVSWIHGEESFWIDGNGFVYIPQGNADKLVMVHANTPPPILLTSILEGGDTENGPDSLGLVSSELVPAILNLRRNAPDGSDLVYDSHHGFGWGDSRGWKAYFGTEVRNIVTKFNVYRSIVDQLLSEGLNPVFISVEHVHAPYYRME